MTDSRDFLDSLFDAVRTRVRSPVVGNVMLAWSLLHWKIFFLAFSNLELELKIRLIEEQLSCWGLVWAVSTGISLALGLPYLSAFIAWATSRARETLHSQTERRMSQDAVIREYRLQAYEKKLKEREEELLKERRTFEAELSRFAEDREAWDRKSEERKRLDEEVRVSRSELEEAHRLEALARRDKARRLSNAREALQIVKAKTMLSPEFPQLCAQLAELLADADAAGMMIPLDAVDQISSAARVARGDITPEVLGEIARKLVSAIGHLRSKD